MEPNVRPARLSDAAVVADFNARLANETEGRLLDPGRLRAGVEALIQDASKGVYYVAEIENSATFKVIGQLLLTYEWSDWRNGTFWWIQSVFVSKPFRGRGVFRTLYKYVREMARSRPDVCGLRLYVERENLKAQQTYASLGMHRTAYEMFEVDFVMTTASDLAPE